MEKYQGNSPEKRSVKKNIPPSPKKCLNNWQAVVNKYKKNLGEAPSFAQADQNIEDEFASYTASRVVQTDILHFWQVRKYLFISSESSYLSYVIQANERTFPTIFKIAMDYLPIQALAVPCERVFSSSSETDTKKRNRLGADIMEALQILKFDFKRERLDFVSHWVTPVMDLAPDNEDDDVYDQAVQVVIDA